jgi:enediyne polyketide synthase
MGEGIAIVGMACRYAGTRSPAELWENVLAGRREFRRIPAERLRLADYQPADPGDPAAAAEIDTIYSSEAALLSGWELDRVRFRVAGSTFRATDLAHWLALEVAVDAFADAGFPDAAGLPRETTGVLVGNSLTGEMSRAQLLRLRWPYVRRVVGASLARQGWDPGRLASYLRELEEEYKAPFPRPNEESLAGGLSNTIAGRICNHLDLQGGGYTVDGACSSSLLAVANACSALAAGDLDAALAGGVDLSLDPFELVGFARTGALAADEMRVYDARATGFIPGEGCGLLVLMRLADAQRRGCRIQAVIRGWGISSDGHGGISRPEVEGQRLALARAYRRAGFGIEEVGYFEGHGTGTAVGDTAELEALSAELDEARRKAGASHPALSAPSAPAAPATPAAVGSIKANLGHTKAAAGVAGLIKAVLAIEAQVLPPTTGCVEPHPVLCRPGAPLRVLGQGEPWPEDRPLRAAVSAMGFGGINSHVVIASDEATGRRRRSVLCARERLLLASPQDAELFLLAAPDRTALGRRVDQLAALAPRLSRSELTDLAAELARRLQPGLARAARAAIVAATPRELALRLARLRERLDSGLELLLEPKAGLFLAAIADGSSSADGSRSADGAGAAHLRRIGFLFPGQGSPAEGGRGGALARRLEELDEIYALADLPAGGDPVNTASAQPAIIAHSLAGLEALDRLGVRASVAVGHSLGELAALCWAGGLTCEEVLQITRTRARAMAALPGGAMASLAAPPDLVDELRAGTGAAIAAYNGPARTVVSGGAAAVAAVEQQAAERGITSHRLRVSHAFHSPAMAAAGPELGAALDAVPRRSLARPVVSTVTGALLPPGADLRDLLVRQLEAPVRFAEALGAARGLADLWIEVGPGNVLAELAGEVLEAPVIPLDAGGPSLAGLLAVAGAVYSLGGPVDIQLLFAGRFSRPFDLDRPPSLLGNPCELAPVLHEDLTLAAPARAREPRPEAASAAAPPAPPGTPLDLVRDLVAERSELPVAAVHADSRLLSDLHLSSISVGQLVAEAARRLGLRPPASPLDYAHATVGAVARALEEQAATAQTGAEAEPETAPPGVDSWVRPFTVSWVERALPRAPSTPAAPAAPVAGLAEGAWRIVAPDGFPLREPLAAELAQVPGRGVALCLPPEPDESHVGLFVEAARAVLAEPAAERFLVVQQGGGGGGFARTVHLEIPGITTCVVDLPLPCADAAACIGREARAARGFTDVRYDPEGRRWVPVLRLLAPADAPQQLQQVQQLPMGPEDVLLVTGGGKGIGAECALDLARATGVRLALLGRSDPATDPELAANLERIRAAGVQALYVPADLTDAEQARSALCRVQEELGPVTALLHAAGSNVPRLLGALDEAGFRATLAPKVRGLDNLLGGLDTGRLRLLIAFGSIIGRAGLRGEADYATANEWLRLRVERFAREHPGCRGLVVEWSVWAGVGMGERLGTLEGLLRQGITPIPPEVGVAALRDLLARPLPATSILVAGRFGAPATLELERPELPLLRYLERPRVFVPGVELVVDTGVSAQTDPHLADHVLRGEPLFAAVLGLEAMAQAALAVTGRRELPVFEKVELLRPVVVSPDRSTTLRIAALVREPGRVEVVLRDSATGFQTDHFRAVCRFAERGPEIGDLAARLRGDAAGIRFDPGELYGGILFHAGRFRRLQEYRHLKATECVAEISADGSTSWFGPWLPDRLVLGDPGARDAAIHGIQACIPHRVLLPTGVDRIVTGRLPAAEALTLAAREVSREGDDFVYDLEISGPDGAVRERWEGLRLRAVDRTPTPPAWSAALLGPWVERRLQDLFPQAGMTVALETSERRDSTAAVAGLLGGGGLRHRPDGRPEPESGGGISVAHAGGLVLVVAQQVQPVQPARQGRIGCDLELIADRSEAVWRDLLGEDHFRLGELIARERGEEPSVAATRVWTALESLRKAGAPPGTPLTLAEAEEGGWLFLRSGSLRIATLLASLRELSGPAVLAVLAET